MHFRNIAKEWGFESTLQCAVKIRGNFNGVHHTTNVKGKGQNSKGKKPEARRSK
jgi:hypothetical protein